MLSIIYLVFSPVPRRTPAPLYRSLEICDLGREVKRNTVAIQKCKDEWCCL